MAHLQPNPMSTQTHDIILTLKAPLHPHICLVIEIDGFSTVQCIGLAVMPEDDEYFCPDCKTGLSLLFYIVDLASNRSLNL